VADAYKMARQAGAFGVEDELHRMRQRAEQAEAALTDVLGEVQKYQPAGSPPPGIRTLVRWIMQSKESALAQAREENERLRDYLQQWTVNDMTTLQLFQRLDAALAIAVALSVSHPHIGTPLVKALKGEK